MEMLKKVYYKLEENHQAGLSELFEELEAEGICRIVAGERNNPGRTGRQFRVAMGIL